MNFGRLARRPKALKKFATVESHIIVAQHGPVRTGKNKGSLKKTILKRPPQQLQCRNNCVEFAGSIWMLWVFWGALQGAQK